MWAQEWTNIFDLVAPYPEVTSVDVTSLLRNANYSVLRMFREAESFFTSLGLEPMTADFWNKSMLVRPTDGRQVTCHGSAHDLFKETDFRYDIVGHIVVVIVVVDDDSDAAFTCIITALHGMQSRYSDGNSVCPSVHPSVCPSVCQTRAL